MRNVHRITGLQRHFCYKHCGFSTEFQFSLVTWPHCLLCSEPIIPTLSTLAALNLLIESLIVVDVLETAYSMRSSFMKSCQSG